MLTGGNVGQEGGAGGGLGLREGKAACSQQGLAAGPGITPCRPWYIELTS